MLHPAIMNEEPQNSNFNQSQIEPNQEEDGPNDDLFITPQLLEDWIFELSLRLVNYSFYFLAICLHLLKGMPLFYLLIYSISLDFLILLLSFRKAKLETLSFMRIRAKINIIEKILMISFKTLLLLYLLTNAFLLSFSILFLILHTLLRLFLYLVYKSQSECFALLDFLSILWRLFMTVISLGIFLKFDGFISWSLKQVLLPFWIFFSVEIGLNFAVFLMILSKILQKYYENIDNSEIVGLLWVFFQTSFYLLSGLVFMTGLVDFFENGSDFKIQGLVWYLAFSLLVFVGFTVFTRKNILAFFLLVSKIENTNENSNGNSQNNQNNSNNHANNAHQRGSDGVSPKKKRKPLTIPKYLVKFSSTYFKKSLNDSFNTIRKTIGRFPKPQKTHTRSISMNWVFREAQKRPKKATPVEINPDILFTLPSEKEKDREIPNEKEKETARFEDIANKKENNLASSKRGGHGRIYSMYIQRSSGELESSERGGKLEEKRELAANQEKSTANCLICFDKIPDSVFMECGHGGICYDCALDVWKTTGECYLCRKEISHVLQLDLKENVGNYMKVLASTEMDESNLSEHKP